MRFAKRVQQPPAAPIARIFQIYSIRAQTHAHIARQVGRMAVKRRKQPLDARLFGVMTGIAYRTRRYARLYRRVQTAELISDYELAARIFKQAFAHRHVRNSRLI